MGTTSEKLTYLNNTKQLLKDKINNLGGSIDNNTTFRNYANQLQNVYDNLPKTEYQEGTEVNLGKTIKGKLDYENGVVGIGQSEQESTQGYQLISLKDGTYTGNSGVTIKVENGKCTLNGTSSASEVIPVQLKDNLSLTNGQTYTLYGFNDVANSNVAFRPRIDEGFFQVAFDTTNKVESKTYNGTSISVAYIGIRVGSGTTITNLVCKPMLISGNDTTKSYEPYTNGASPNPSYPQTINSVTGNQDVVVSGKNKLNFSDVTLESHGVTLQIKDNYFILNGTNDGTESAFIISNYMTPFQTNANTKLKAFQISGTATGSIANPLFRTYTNWQNQVNVNFTSSTISDYSEEATYNTSIIAVHGGTFNNYKIGFMVADNLTDSDTYEPYITPTSYQLSLGDIQLNAIGNYKDELIYDVDEDKVYKNEKLIKIDITSNLNWLTSGSGKWWYFNNYMAQLPIDANSEIMSNCFIKGNWNDASDSNTPNIISLGNQSNGIIGITTASFSSLEAMKTFLGNNDVYAIAQLRNAVEKPITDTTLINQVKALYNAHSNNGTTIITSNGDLPMIIKVRGLKGE